MAKILNGYRGQSDPEDQIKDITNTYDPGIMGKNKPKLTKEEREIARLQKRVGKVIDKGKKRAIKHEKLVEKSANKSDRWKLRKGLEINPVESSTGEISHQRAQYLSSKGDKVSAYNEDVLQTPLTIDKSKFKNVFEKGEYVGTKKKWYPGINRPIKNDPIKPLKEPKEDKIKPDRSKNTCKKIRKKRGGKGRNRGLYSTAFNNDCPDF